MADNNTDSNLEQRICELQDTDFTLTPPFPSKRMKIEISNYCNHSCLFCGRNKAKFESGFISEELFDRVLREAHELGVREIGLFINAEPFTSKNLAQYVKTAKDIGFSYVYVTTNGALAVPTRLKEVIDAGLDSIKFSVNAGTKETYKKIHGRDDFDVVCENIKYCFEYRAQSHKKYNIFGSCVVTKMVESELESVKEKIGRYMDELCFYKIRDTWGVVAKNADLGTYEYTSRKRCTSPFNAINVSHDGFLLACCEDINHDLIVGDLNKQSLKEAWYGEAMTLMRKRHMTYDLEPICRECLKGGADYVEVLESVKN